MPTSSIFTTVRITDPKIAEDFINALDAAANAPRIEEKKSNVQFLTDPDEIKALFTQRDKQ